ncbi:MAG: methyltransferase domain-containing protein, partial [Nitrososphaerota archaeon]
EKFINNFLVSPSLHVFCGESRLGDVRVDLFTDADVRADGFRLPFRDNVFMSIVSDPPWNMPYHLRPRLAKEFFRVLRPGGKLILNAPWCFGLSSLLLEEVYYAMAPAWRNCPLIMIYRKFSAS